MRAHRAYATYDPAKPFAGWILRIASNHCVDVMRRRGKESEIFGNESQERIEAEADDTDVVGELITAERAREVQAAVATLPERYRVPLTLAYYNDSGYDEIAAALGLTRTHVGVLLCRAKQALRRTLTDMEENR